MAKSSSFGTRLLVVLVAGLLLAAPAAAQTTTTTTTTATTTTTTNGNGSDQERSYWDISGGFERDSLETRYGYFGPSYNHSIGGNKHLVFKVSGSYLKYEFDNGDGTRTHVSGPGLSPTIGLRFGGSRGHFKVTAGPDFKKRDRDIIDAAGNEIREESNETRVGARLGADLWTEPVDHWNVHAMGTFGTAEEWLFTRLMVRRQLTNLDWRGPLAFYLGAEGMAQGNDEIRQFQGGPVLEVTHARTSLTLGLRAGWKRSTFDTVPDKNGTYVGIGLWRRFN